MSRFDVFANPDVTERKHTPYFVDVQNEQIDALPTRVVIPLRREAAFGPRARHLNPMLVVGAESVVLDTAALGAVPTVELRKTVGNVRESRMDIQEALDIVFGVF